MGVVIRPTATVTQRDNATVYQVPVFHGIYDSLQPSVNQCCCTTSVTNVSISLACSADYLVARLKFSFDRDYPGDTCATSPAPRPSQMRSRNIWSHRKGNRRKGCFTRRLPYDWAQLAILWLLLLLLWLDAVGAATVSCVALNHVYTFGV